MSGTKLVDIEDIDRIVGLILASAHIEGEKPLSCLLVSDRPESAKSTLVMRYGKVKGTKIFGKGTSHALIKYHRAELQRGEIKHFLLPEFLGPLSYSPSVVNSFITLLQEMTEEGLTSVYSGSLKSVVKFKEPMIVGIIGAMPREMYMKQAMSWMASGFLSRMVIVTYRYSKPSIERIKQSIVLQQYRDEVPAYMPVPSEKYHIDMPVAIAEACLEISDQITAQAQKDGNLYGFRELKHIMSLVMANVALENMVNGGLRTEATMQDFTEIARLSYLFNEQFKELRVKTEQPEAKELTGLGIGGCRE